ncbi:MAG: ABC transporter substrate-binding protein [Methylophaga sp.]|nr:MAG: ABC transporter substrate-binding protein [Methylophaga sp.]
MRRFWPLLFFVSIFAMAILGINTQLSTGKNQHLKPQRIITLAPSITETVFALDLGDSVVGVTDYCDYPPTASKLPKVGGFINPNFEAILSLQPDLVILLSQHQKVIQQLSQLNIPTLAVDNSTLKGITESIKTIGQATDQTKQSAQLLANIDQKINYIQSKTAHLSKPSVLISMGHSLGGEQLNTVYIAGQNDFYNDLISLAGGQNVYQQTQIKVPSLSVEGILQLNPDIILDIFPEADDHHADLSQVLKQWQKLKFVNAVKHDHIYFIEQNYATIPGPRIFLLLEKIAKFIHPEIDWEDKGS